MKTTGTRKKAGQGNGKAGTKAKAPAVKPIPLRVSGYGYRLPYIFWKIDLNLALRSDVQRGIIRFRKWQSETLLILEMLEAKVRTQEIKLPDEMDERNARLKSGVETILNSGGWSEGVVMNIRAQKYINLAMLKSQARNFGTWCKELTYLRESLGLVYN